MGARLRFSRCVLILALSGVLAAPLLAGERGARAEYVGGTVTAIPGKSQGVIETTDERFFVFRTKKDAVRVPYAQIDLLEYGQKVDRRYAMAVLVSPLLLLSKNRRHFLTIGYVDEEGHRQALVFRLDKDDVRAVLVIMEIKTGRKIVFQDEEARKAGKG